MIMPTAILVGLFTFYPYFHAIWGSFQTLSPILPPKFVGLLNYSQVITSSYFAGTVRNTLVFAVIAVPIIVALGTAVASLINQKFRGGIALRAILLLPWAIPTAMSGVIWKGVFADSWGALNAVLYSLGIIPDYVEWLTTPTLAMLTVIIAHVWTQFPMAAVLILAAMQAISEELYDAAAIDGAGVWQRFRYVTIPNIKAMLIVVALYEILVALTAFDITYGLTGGGPGTATTLISYFTWAETFRMLNFGRGAALSVIIALVSIILILGLLRAMPKDALVEE
jgi:ABC-type sugar transport system permease subunit